VAHIYYHLCFSLLNDYQTVHLTDSYLTRMEIEAAPRCLLAPPPPSLAPAYAAAAVACSPPACNSAAPPQLALLLPPPLPRLQAAAA
jgi:hypothetical protein